MKNLQIKTGIKIIFFLLLFVSAAPLFAQVIPPQLQTVSQQIEEAFTGPIVKIILVCCLAACGIAYAFNKDNEKMKRNLIAIIVGIVIIGAATEIVAMVGNNIG